MALAARSSSRISPHCAALDVDSGPQTRAAGTAGAPYSVFVASPHLLPSANYVGTAIIVGTISRSVGTTLQNAKTERRFEVDHSNLVAFSVWLDEVHSGRWETVMANATRSGRLLALVATFALGVSLAGCATESLQGVDLMQRIADADTRSEHEDLAASYEQEAKAAEETVAYHQRMQRLYEARRDRPSRGKLQMEPYVDYDPGTSAQWDAFVKACESRVRGAEQAAEDYRTLARVHRQIAAEARQ